MKKVILGSLAAFIGLQANAEVSCKKLLVSEEAALRELMSQNFPGLKVTIEAKNNARQVSLAFEKPVISELKYDVIKQTIEFKQDRYDNTQYSKRASSREYDATLNQRSGLIKIVKLGYTPSTPTKGAIAITTDGREGTFHQPSRNNHDYGPTTTLEFIIDGAQTISSAGHGKFIVGTNSGEIYLINPVKETMKKATIGEAIALENSKASTKDVHPKTASDGEYTVILNERDSTVELSRTGSESDRRNLRLPIDGMKTIRSADTKGQFIIETNFGEIYVFDAVTRVMRKTTVEESIVLKDNKDHLPKSASDGKYVVKLNERDDSVELA